MTKEPGPYILVTDNDCHHYVIPKVRERDWDKWCDYDDENSFAKNAAITANVPEWAESVGGAPSLIEFDSYRVL